MNGRFSDHFAAVAAQYADSRPRYPDSLFDWLAAQCAPRDLAWDCGAGSGQASIALARHFTRVIATDASAAQIAQAQPDPRVEYRVAPAECSTIDDASADLVIVAQALHWFDLDRFYAEVRRVLRPGGLIAAWSYGVLAVEGAAVNTMVQRFYHDEVGPYWPPERRHVENAYRELRFPFERIAAPDFEMSLHWNLAQLLGYFRSWSATARYIERRGDDPVARLAPQLAAYWGDAGQLREIRWPLALLAGRCATP
ncbi:MAG TPA: class I SAM-dependent methyltransferase [Rhodocyclaceae bacterium]|nr:class I SAM-dependent methyltransferase [Rhodocyclaceae bacterium]HMZ82697.1 class I SAM-dependent methyltransferase [Rhodocyclaceae bacterium]HNA02720.1 class I SAM-dependent methyltransferase [Rhodocyclaceae bacterium]HNB77378.1 class I SAM-dependent methyltransferase [Rhodocyclaceae bacterium]HNC60985.1 class I SAM-dependent methyltransferase [Rhodocyclaceae bacterium]